MACNFKIGAHRNSENLHLRLEGDFDGSSALQLINYLKRSIHKNSKIIIHTNCLKNIHPFGTTVFKNNFVFPNPETVTFLFTGDRATQLAPGRNTMLCALS